MRHQYFAEVVEFIFIVFVLKKRPAYEAGPVKYFI